MSDNNMVDGRPACRPCKLKKKRCPHRFVVESEAELDCEPTSEALPEAPTKRVRGAINGKVNWGLAETAFAV